MQTQCDHIRDLQMWTAPTSGESYLYAASSLCADLVFTKALLEEVRLTLAQSGIGYELKLLSMSNAATETVRMQVRQLIQRWRATVCTAVGSYAKCFLMARH